MPVMVRMMRVMRMVGMMMLAHTPTLTGQRRRSKQNVTMLQKWLLRMDGARDYALRGSTLMALRRKMTSA